MPAIVDLLRQMIGEEEIAMIGRQIGADLPTTRRAIASVLPVLVGGLARNANRSAGDAQTLARSLDQSHDGSLLDHVAALLQGSGDGAGGAPGLPANLFLDRRAVDGDGILEYVMGTKRNAVEVGISRASGLSPQQVSQLLPLLAPLVMGALGRLKRERKLDADGIATLLNKERAEIERHAPEVRQGKLHDLLDLDDDGSIREEVVRLGEAFGADDIVARLLGRPADEHPGGR